MSSTYIFGNNKNINKARELVKVINQLVDC